MKADGNQDAAAHYPTPKLVPQTDDATKRSPALERLPQQGEFAFPPAGAPPDTPPPAGAHGQRVSILPAAGLPGVGAGRVG